MRLALLLLYSVISCEKKDHCVFLMIWREPWTVGCDGGRRKGDRVGRWKHTLHHAAAAGTPVVDEWRGKTTMIWIAVAILSFICCCSPDVDRLRVTELDTKNASWVSSSTDNCMCIKRPRHLAFTLNLHRGPIDISLENNLKFRLKFDSCIEKQKEDKICQTCKIMRKKTLLTELSFLVWCTFRFSVFYLQNASL